MEEYPQYIMILSCQSYLRPTFRKGIIKAISQILSRHMRGKVTVSWNFSTFSFSSLKNSQFRQLSLSYLDSSIIWIFGMWLNYQRIPNVVLIRKSNKERKTSAVRVVQVSSQTHRFSHPSKHYIFRPLAHNQETFS